MKHRRILFFFKFSRKSEAFYPTGKQTEIWSNSQYLTWNCEALSAVENLL